MFAIPPRGTYSDSSYYERFQRTQLSALGFAELSDKVSKSLIPGIIEIDELYRKFTLRLLGEIYRNIADGFKQYFDTRLQVVASTYGPDTRVVADMRNLEEFYRKSLTTNALNVRCLRVRASDLPIVRKTVDEHSIDFSEHAVLYLGKFGDWSDRDRILAFLDRYTAGSTLLSDLYTRKSRVIGNALHKSGRKRLPDLLNLKLQPEVRRYIIEALTRKEVRQLLAPALIGDLYNENQDVRKAVAIKLVTSLSQTEVRRILNHYLSQAGNRYYNCIHWLDLGASMPRELVSKVARIELSEHSHF